MRVLGEDFKDNVRFIDDELRVDKSFDILSKKLKIGKDELRLYYVDGFDNTDGKWVEGWFTDGSVDTKESLAYFIDFVLNP